MARNTVVKNEHFPAASDNDPLAELSRIMGLDRNRTNPSQDDVDFGIDLEKELLGDFDVANTASEPLVETDDDLEALFDELSKSEPQPSGADDLDFSFDAADFAAADAELTDEAVAGEAATDVAANVDHSAGIADYAAAQVGGIVSEAVAPTDSATSDLSFEDELGALLGDDSVAAPVTAEPVADFAADDVFAFDEDVAADAPSEMQLSAEPDVIAVEDAAVVIEDDFAYEPDFGAPAAEFDAATSEIAFEQVGQSAYEADDQSEPEAYISQDELDATIAELEADHEWAAAPTPEPAVSGGHVEAFDDQSPLADEPAEQPRRSRFSFLEPKQPAAPEQLVEQELDPFEALAALAAAPPILRTLKRSNPVAVNQEPVRPAAPAATFTAPASPAVLTETRIVSSAEPVVHFAAEPEFEAAEVDFDLDHRGEEEAELNTQDWQIKPSSTELDWSAAEQVADTTPAAVDAATVDFDMNAFDDVDLDLLAADDFASELETVDVQDDVIAVTDDLDLPELEIHSEPVPRQFDDFDADFADAFRQLGDANGPATAKVAPVAAAPSHNEPTVDQMLDADFASFQRDFDANESTHSGIDDFEENLAEGIDPERQRSRLPLFGAIFAGLLVAAAAGAYAFGLFGSDQNSAPALVRADTSPVKVKPETPGGVVVPNQDGQVYERVAGVDPKAPAQQKLVSKVEEPIVPKPAATGEALPGVESPQIKSEERVLPASSSDASSSEQAVGIAPKKVRTMVVRPDGTLAPRAEPAAAPEVQAVAPAPVETAAAKPEPEAAAPVVAAPEPKAVEEVLAPKPVKTTTIKPKAAPEPKPEPEQVVAKAEPAPVDMAGGTAVTGSAAASGDLWNVQIASQPTREGAQSSYESLARKYGGVIGGKGVNIVQANIEGKGTMWRVRIPAASKNDANILCAKLKTAGGSCFVSR